MLWDSEISQHSKVALIMIKSNDYQGNKFCFVPFYTLNKTYSDYSKIRYFCPTISAYTLSENYQKISKREVVRFFGRFSVCFCLCFRGKQSTCVNYQIKIQENLPWRKDEFLDKNGVLEQCDCIWSHPNAVR